MSETRTWPSSVHARGDIDPLLLCKLLLMCPLSREPEGTAKVPLVGWLASSSFESLLINLVANIPVFISLDFLWKKISEGTEFVSLSYKRFSHDRKRKIGVFRNAHQKFKALLHNLYSQKTLHPGLVSNRCVFEWYVWQISGGLTLMRLWRAQMIWKNLDFACLILRHERLWKEKHCELPTPLPWYCHAELTGVAF